MGESLGTVALPVAERRELGAASDHDLVAAVRCGDDRAFEKLYERYQRRIAAYVYGMVNDYGKAEDITQEVFISALRRMRETERPIAFKPWIYEIAKNACIDQFRRSRRAEEISFDADEGAGALETARLAAPGATPDAAVDAKQALSNLCGAFGGLSETHHEILVLRELEGLSYREIGERMGLSRPSVESTLFRARRRLTEEYDELISGQRCTRIQSIIGTAGEGMLGARDQRRLARHVAHCQPCRREARMAGLDTTTLSRPAVAAAARKVAALLPFPGLFKLRRPGAVTPLADGQGSNMAAQWSSLASMAEPIAGWGKAAIAAAALVVAGGAGVATREALTPGPSHPSESTGVSIRNAATATKAAKAPKAHKRMAAAKHIGASPVRTKTHKAASGGTAAGATTTPAIVGAKAPSTAGTPSAGGTSSGPPSIPSNPLQPGDGSTAGGGGGQDPVQQVTGTELNTSAEPVDQVQKAGNSVDPALGDAIKSVQTVINGG